MKKKVMATIALFFCVSTAPAFAEDSPEKLIQATAEAAQEVQVVKETPEQRWENFLASKGWDSSLNEGGVIIIPDRELIISSASEFTKVGLGQPGWVESRVVAFEKAEMEAKAKIIRYLAESVETKRSLSFFEHAAWSDGEVKKVKDLGDVQKTLERIGKKALALTEGTLDSAIAKVDPDYDPEKYANKSPEELKVIAEDLFSRQIKAVAMKSLIGVTPLYSTEAKGSSEYQVLVGVIWSPKLNRLAMNLFNDEYSIPPVKAGKPLTQQIPGDDLTLLSNIGTRIVIDENGEFAVMAYGQAQPRRTSPKRAESALHQAKQVAANRAKAAMVNFIKEGLALRDEEISQELSQEFSDMTVGTETIREYKHSIKGKKVKVKLSGLRVLKEWSMEHPATGQKVAGAVVAWSPASATLSKQADQMMKAKPKASAGQTGKTGTAATPTAEPKLQSMEVDTSAY